MQVFAVFKVADSSLVMAGVNAHYPSSYYKAGDDVFFIATEGETTRQLATKIGLGDGNPGEVTSGIVIPVTSYWGRYNAELWEWISVKQSSNGR